MEKLCECGRPATLRLVAGGEPVLCGACTREAQGGGPSEEGQMDWKAELSRLEREAEDLTTAQREVEKRAERAERAERERVQLEFKPELDAARAKRWKAEQAIVDARLKMNEAEPPVPLGTRMVKWAAEWHAYGSPALQPVPLKLTGERGVLQLLRYGDPTPDRRTWGQPKVGDLVVRLLRKDGTEGKTVVSYRTPEGAGGGWWPEGVQAVATPKVLPGWPANPEAGPFTEQEAT